MAKGMKIRKGDRVVVLAGKDKGRTGEVLRAFPKEQRVLVQGVNMVTKHVRPSATSAGGIERVEAPIHISNVQYYDAEAKRGKRLGSRTEQVERDGRTKTVRVRVTRGHGDAEKDI